MGFKPVEQVEAGRILAEALKYNGLPQEGLVPQDLDPLPFLGCRAVANRKVVESIFQVHNLRVPDPLVRIVHEHYLSDAGKTVILLSKMHVSPDDLPDLGKTQGCDDLGPFSRVIPSPFDGDHLGDVVEQGPCLGQDKIETEPGPGKEPTQGDSDLGDPLGVGDDVGRDIVTAKDLETGLPVR